jgi:hypothetical protein
MQATDLSLWLAIVWMHIRCTSTPTQARTPLGNGFHPPHAPSRNLLSRGPDPRSPRLPLGGSRRLLRRAAPSRVSPPLLERGGGESGGGGASGRERGGAAWLGRRGAATLASTEASAVLLRKQLPPERRGGASIEEWSGVEDAVKLAADRLGFPPLARRDR